MFKWVGVTHTKLFKAANIHAYKTKQKNFWTAVFNVPLVEHHYFKIRLHQTKCLLKLITKCGTNASVISPHLAALSHYDISWVIWSQDTTFPLSHSTLLHTSVSPPPHPRSHTDRIGRKPQSVTAAGAALNCCPAATEKAHLPKKEQFQIKPQHPCTIQTQRTLRAPNSAHHPIINEGGKPFSFGEGVHRTLISW